MLRRGEKIAPRMYQKTSHKCSKVAPGAPGTRLGPIWNRGRFWDPAKCHCFGSMAPPGGPQGGHFENGFAPRAPQGPSLGPSWALKKKVTLRGLQKAPKVSYRWRGASKSQNRFFCSKTSKNVKSQPPGGSLGPLGGLF